MYKVAFVTRDRSSYAYEEEKYEICFMLEKDANTFYDDLENYVDESTGGDCYVDRKSKPERLPTIQLYGYDPSIKKLFRVD